LRRIGIDTGGTFTDLVYAEDARIVVEKVPSTPNRPEEAVIAGLKVLDVRDDNKNITYGSTVATNSILERKGARVALAATRGFEDIIFIGRQNRPQLYSLNPRKVAPLVREEMVVGIRERLSAEGTVIEDLSGLERAADRLRKMRPEAIAVCLLHSYANPRHERLLKEALDAALPGIPVTLSSDISPEHREYERTSTTLLNAYVLPVMRKHLSLLEEGIGPGRLRVMQSNGGCISAGRAAEEPIKTVLSGPAGGVVGALWMARTAGHENIITFDMGGTSTDVSLCSGRPRLTGEYSMEGLPMKTPVMDVHTVGAGGGSMVKRDRGGGLRVGPESAGAEPGPICYGRGGDTVTVTDANLMLGRLPDAGLLGGNMELNGKAARRGLDLLADRVEMEPMDLAEGIISMALSTMRRAITVISTQRGYDPRDHVLVSYGGAGPLHACELAREMGMNRVLVPAYPGVLSAFGMAVSDVVKHYSASVMRETDKLDHGEIEALFEPLERKARAEMEREGFRDENILMERSLDMRYRRQGYELNIPFDETFGDRFHREHLTRYGHFDVEEPVKIVNLRLKVLGLTEKTEMVPVKMRNENDDGTGEPFYDELFYHGKELEAALYERAELRGGDSLVGPALVTEYSATTFIPPGFSAKINPLRGLEICEDRI